MSCSEIRSLVAGLVLGFVVGLPSAAYANHDRVCECNSAADCKEGEYCEPGCYRTWFYSAGVCTPESIRDMQLLTDVEDLVRLIEEELDRGR